MHVITKFFVLGGGGRPGLVVTAGHLSKSLWIKIPVPDARGIIIQIKVFLNCTND